MIIIYIIYIILLPNSNQAVMVCLYDGYRTQCSKKGRKDLSDPNKKVYTLPSESEIMRRLQSVGSEYEDLFPLIASSADVQCNASEIVYHISMSIEALIYDQALPITDMFITIVPRWIDVLVDDPEIAEAAKEILKKAPYAPRVLHTEDDM